MTNHSQITARIERQLLKNLKRGDCVLFLGADLPLGYESAPLSRPELANALANKHRLPTGQSWSETAQAYLGKFLNDRNGLISFVREQYDASIVKPGPLHRAIVHAGFRAIVTAWYDELLEDTLRSAGYRVHRVVRDLHLLYSGQNEREVTIIKLFGSVSDPESLVLTKQDQVRLLGELGHKLKAVISFVQKHPLLFIGHDLTDDTLMFLYNEASRDVVKHMRRAYAVWPKPTTTMRGTWAGMNLEFLDYEPASFLEALASETQAAGSDERRAIRVNCPPYKCLDFYESKDAYIFCGRDTESQIVTRLALSDRLLTLFGTSGAGKTSLLLAGVLPRLHADGYHAVCVRILDTPLRAVCNAVAASLGIDDSEGGVGFDASTSMGALRSFLIRTIEPQYRLVIIIDQFEELFLRVGIKERLIFFREVAVTLDHPERDARFIFSLREDYLAYLDEARTDLPNILANSYRLKTLDRSNARVAITEPAIRTGVVVEPALVAALVGGEGRAERTGDLLDSDGYIPPAALQIVLDRLYRDALPPDHGLNTLPPSGLTLTLEHYLAIHHRLSKGDDKQELTGAKAILADYVSEALDRLPNLNRGEGNETLCTDKDLSRSILKVMVTSALTNK